MQTCESTSCTFDGCGGTKIASNQGIEKTKKTPAVIGTTEVAHFVAGAVGLEPTTNGFGDHYSTN